MNKADVVLISVENGFLPSYSLLSLESFLSREGIKTEILYPALTKDSPVSLAKKIREIGPKVVGMGGLFGDRFIIRSIIQALAPYRSEFMIVLGGNLVTPIPEFMLEKLFGDIAVVGEGEIIFTNLVKHILGKKDYRGIGGLAYREKEAVKSTGPGEYIEDLNQLPPLNYEKLPMEHFINVYKFYKNYTRNNFFKPGSRLGTVFSGRGCPHRCNFCYHHGKLRLMDIPNVITQIKTLKERFGLNLIQFVDDLVLLNKKRALELCSALRKEKLNLEYIASAHLNCLDEEMVIALKESGFVQIGLGLESGSQPVLDRISKKVTLEQIKSGIDLLRKYKINWNGAIQIGQIGETIEDVKKTRDFYYSQIDELSTISVAITTPYPGTPIYHYGLRTGLIKNNDQLFHKLRDLRSLAVNFSELRNWKIKYLRLKLSLVFDMKKQRIIRGNLKGWLFLLKAVLMKIFCINR
ncbi:MAG: radical SAM protein [Candidatus Omnitrophica bacterium]|nr:radical SAM protein [Candidatus Omnitrophota bacterium]